MILVGPGKFAVQPDSKPYAHPGCLQSVLCAPFGMSSTKRSCDILLRSVYSHNVAKSQYGQGNSNLKPGLIWMRVPRVVKLDNLADDTAKPKTCGETADECSTVAVTGCTVASEVGVVSVAAGATTIAGVAGGIYCAHELFRATSSLMHLHASLGPRQRY